MSFRRGIGWVGTALVGGPVNRLIKKSQHTVLPQCFNVLKKYSTPAGVSIDATSNRLVVQWQGSSHPFPLVWLRDNCQCPACFDSSSQSRTIDFSTFNVCPRLKSAAIAGHRIHVIWDDGHESPYDADWLRQRSFRPEEQQKWLDSNYQSPYKTWNADGFKALPVLRFRDLMDDDSSLLRWLEHLEVFGVCLVSEVPHQLGQVRLLADRVGFIRKTHYGEEFEVQAKADATNVAYTSGYLPLHTDLPYYEYKPGINLLHVYIQYSGDGGDSLLSDGFHVAEWLRQNEPHTYRALADTEVSWLDIGQENGHHFHSIHNGPVICETSSGTVKRINYSQPQRDSHMAVSLERVEDWYRALKRFYELAMHRDNLVKFKLEPGQMVTFNNLRVLHGRTGFGSDLKGERHVQGAYLDWDEVRSKIRILRAEMSTRTDRR